MVKKSISEASSNSCSFCVIKDNEIKKRETEIQRLETKLKNVVEGKPKKEYTPEQLEELKKKKEEKKQNKEKKEKEYKETFEQNKKLKQELLTRFGVQV